MGEVVIVFAIILLAIVLFINFWEVKKDKKERLEVERQRQECEQDFKQKKEQKKEQTLEEFYELEQPKEQPDVFRGYTVYMIGNKFNSAMYIGVTGSYNRRKKQHFDETYRQEFHYKYLYQRMQKHGSNKFYMAPLFVGLSKEEAEYIEARLIKGWSTLKPYGYNVAEEGDNRKLGYEVAIANRKLFDLIKMYAVTEIKRLIVHHRDIILTQDERSFTIKLRDEGNTIVYPHTFIWLKDELNSNEQKE
jgi:hypothetical protein